MDEASWKTLLRLIRDGFVVPVVGGRLLVGPEGKSSLQAQVAERLLMDKGEKVGDQPLPPFRELNEVVTRLKSKGTANWQLYDDVDIAIRKVTCDAAIPVPIRQLAEIAGFRLFVTLTPDDLLARSLGRRCAVNEIVHSPDLPNSEQKDLPEDWQKRTGEVQLLYLFGKARSAALFAIHDEDVLEYAHNVIARNSKVPEFIGALRERSLLLIGCNFPEWLSRFFLRATKSARLSKEVTQSEWLIDQLQPEESLTCFLRSYSKDTHILSDIPPEDFVAELHRRWMAEHGADEPNAVASAGKEVPRGTTFFISYSRTTDLRRAEELYQALLNLGVTENEVWFDRRNIDPGQEYRQRILDGIRTCRYFLPLLSKAANDREGAFVFSEWREANHRNKEMNREFLIPVIVDADYDPERYTAQPIKEGEWTRSKHFGHAPEGLPDGQTTNKLKKLVRDTRAKREA